MRLPKNMNRPRTINRMCMAGRLGTISRPRTVKEALEYNQETRMHYIKMRVAAPELGLAKNGIYSVADYNDDTVWLYPLHGVGPYIRLENVNNYKRITF